MKKNLTFAEEMARAERKNFIVMCISLVCLFAFTILAGYVGLSVYTDEASTEFYRYMALISNILNIAVFTFIVVKAIEYVSE